MGSFGGPKRPPMYLCGLKAAHGLINYNANAQNLVAFFYIYHPCDDRPSRNQIFMPVSRNQIFLPLGKK